MVYKADRPGRPPIDFESHRREALLEDAEFLYACHVPIDDACERLGCTRDGLEKLLERRAKANGQANTGSVPHSREGSFGWPVYAMRGSGPAVAPQALTRRRQAS